MHDMFELGRRTRSVTLLGDSPICSKIALVETKGSVSVGRQG